MPRGDLKENMPQRRQVKIRIYSPVTWKRTHAAPQYMSRLRVRPPSRVLSPCVWTCHPASCMPRHCPGTRHLGPIGCASLPGSRTPKCPSCPGSAQAWPEWAGKWTMRPEDALHTTWVMEGEGCPVELLVTGRSIVMPQHKWGRPESYRCDCSSFCSLPLPHSIPPAWTPQGHRHRASDTTGMLFTVMPLHSQVSMVSVWVPSRASIQQPCNNKEGLHARWTMDDGLRRWQHLGAFGLAAQLSAQALPGHHA